MKHPIADGSIHLASLDRGRAPGCREFDWPFPFQAAILFRPIDGSRSTEVCHGGGMAESEGDLGGTRPRDSLAKGVALSSWQLLSLWTSGRTRLCSVVKTAGA